MKILILEGLHGDNKGKKCQWRLERTNLKVGNGVILNNHDWEIIKVIGEKKRSMFPKGAIFSEYGFDDMCEREHLKMFKKLVNDPLIKKIIKRCHRFANVGKEVRKVRPYFECEVVKVKKEKDFWCGGMRIGNKQYKVFKRKKGVPYLKEFEKANWANGENLDKIKFPCFCRYSKDRYGVMTKTYLGEDKETIYTIHGIQRQYFSLSSIKSYNNLKKMIRAFDIHILKGKIIIFEEE